MKVRKYWKVLLVCLTLLVALLPWVKAEAKEKKYLVVVKTENKQYKTLEDAVKISAGGELMVSVEKLAEEFDLTYKGKSKKMILIDEDADIECKYTLGKNKYKCWLASGREVKKKMVIAPEKGYVHYKALDPILKYKYFSTNDTPEYKELGYVGVVIYSLEKIDDTKLPQIEKLDGFEIESSEDDEKETSDVEVPDAEYAYMSLTMVNNYCDAISGFIYDAWYFAIYVADDYYKLSSIIEAYSTYVGFEEEDILEAIDAYLDLVEYESPSDYTRTAVLQTNDGALFVASYILEKKGVFSMADDLLNGVEKYIRDNKKNGEKISGYSELKDYYLEVSSYYDFCYSPSGSFSQLGNTVSTFRENCNYCYKMCKLYFE